MQLYMSWYIISFFGFIFTSYIFFIFSSTPVVTYSIEVVFVLSIKWYLHFGKSVIHAPAHGTRLAYTGFPMPVTGVTFERVTTYRDRLEYFTCSNIPLLFKVKWIVESWNTVFSYNVPFSSSVIWDDRGGCCLSDSPSIIIRAVQLINSIICCKLSVLWSP